jgi:UDP-2,3-diacylglucosamine hydrolase
MTRFPELAGNDIRFVADAHFRDRRYQGESGRRDRFLRFLGSLPNECTLYLIGDIFDFIFGYRSVVSSRYVDIYCALRACTDRGVDLHFIGGNHDYWVGSFFTDQLGIRVHDPESAFEAQGRRVVCAHGDLVMPGDWGYKILKTIIRNRGVVAASRWIHPDLLEAIAEGVSHASRSMQRRSQKQRALEVADRAHEQFFTRGNDIYVMGHVHHPIHDVRDGREFMIVGDWIEDGATYGRLHEGKLTLETFTA